jgi:hypothetical protein
MKRLISILIFSLLVAASSTQADFTGIQVLSQDYSVTASLYISYIGPPPEYDEWGPMPSQVYFEDAHAAPPAHVEMWGFTAAADYGRVNTAMSFTLDPGAQSGFYDITSFEARSTLLFQPLNTAQMTFDYQVTSTLPWDAIEITLDDQTAGSTLLSDFAGGTSILSLDPTHQYRLSLAIYTFGSWSQTASGSSDVLISVTPEPAVILLLGVGALFLTRFRRT